ncbi:hypothetical protein [Nonomuraea maritima]|uniref:hypothetical protein n=1 Tax=Nonomuraea maritima TaxID=683260 RepID=UPI0037154D22
MPNVDEIGTIVFLPLFALVFVSGWIIFMVKLVQGIRQRQVLKYTDLLRATELVGRVRQLKVRGHEDQATELVQDELAMSEKVARSWAKSV